jgi:uncharacterized membrane protein SpoIIM required for sporulation
MIIDLEQFVRREQPYWNELEDLLDRVEERSLDTMDLEEVKRLHYLYRRVSSDLSQIENYISEPELKQYLENLVSRAYIQVHRDRESTGEFGFWNWLVHTLPTTFRKHAWAFLLVVAIMSSGMLFGGAAVALDPGVKTYLLPFSHLQQHPSDRVEQAEENPASVEGAKARFSAMLMTHNIKVSILVLVLGLTFGVGTVVVTFYNGVILGAVMGDYMLAGESVFLAGWLLPHGIIEIPAILMAAQAGMVLAGALVGWEDRNPLFDRLRQVGPELITLISGVAILLVWAGIVESVISQYHEPVFPYELKIAFGVFEGIILVLYLWKSGRPRE